MMLAGRYKTIRRGVTLVELLIVVSIITLLAAIALPAMQTGMESRRIREATRAVHVYFGSAQVRAIETGRPVGVLIERSKIDPRASVLLRQVEVPPPYAGDFDGTTMFLQDWTDVPNQALPALQYMPGYHVVKAFVTSSALSDGIVKYGNRVRLNYGGPLYTIVNDPYEQPDVDFPTDTDGNILFSAGGVLTLRVPASEVNNVPWPDVIPTGAWPPSVDTTVPPWSNATPFQITRDPVPSAAAPLKLPRGMVIDLDDSGDSSSGASDLVGYPTPTMAKDEFAARDWVYGDPSQGKYDPAWGPDKAPRPVLIMFGPDGSVEQVYHTYFDTGPIRTYGARFAQRTIFLMIGRADRTWDSNDPVYATPPPEDGLENWEDAGNLWLALNPQTGRITVAEVNADLPPAANRTANTYIPSSLEASRAFARQAQVSMRGR